jgi:alginate O-acetyltransferase complex protein AlgI
MLFTSPEYLLFLPIVLGMYLLMGRYAGSAAVRLQNIWLLLASYVFYGWWDWRFLALLFGTTLNDYLVGIGLERTSVQAKRRALLTASIAVNLGVLGFFKYYNFFAASLVAAFARMGIEVHSWTLKVILPVGISFYTFQALTYTISVYRRTIGTVRDPVAFFAYVSFFPQLVAGPIERAGHLLPQFLTPRKPAPGHMADGLRQMLWGFFCKLAVADNCAVVVNDIFSRPGPLPGSVVLVGSVMFAFQIYADFSGYSHIAIGTARLFGIDLMQNFATPYFSQSIPQFWRRWHISLSTWFRDFVYIPLGGNQVSRGRQVVNLMTTFILSGLWHGANWTFIVWGFLHGAYCVPRVLIGEPLARFAESKKAAIRVPTVLFRVGVTFSLTVIAWIFFRAANITTAFTMLRELFSASLFTSPVTALRDFGVLSTVIYAGLGICFLLGLEWFQRDKRHALEFETQPLFVRWPAYAGVAALVLVLRYTGESLDFIYFQF